MLIIIGRWLVLLIVNGTLVIVIDIVGNTFSVIVALLDVDCKCEDVINEPLVQAWDVRVVVKYLLFARFADKVPPDVVIMA